MLRDFQRFIFRGSVLGLAIAVVMGAAFTAIVNSLVDDILMPLIGALLGGIDFTSLTVQVGDATIAYGNFIQALINFLLIAATVFLIIRGVISVSRRTGIDTEGLGFEDIVETGEAEEAEAEPEPEPSAEVALLAEIRDLLQAQRRG